MKELIYGVLIAIISGGIGAAVVSAMNERWKFKAERQAAKEDREEERHDCTEAIIGDVNKLKEADQDTDARFEKMERDIMALSVGMRLMMLDRIIDIGQSYIDQGEISFDERRRLRAMHDCYHKDLGGNGDADLVMKGVDGLPLTHQNGVSEHGD